MAGDAAQPGAGVGAPAPGRSGAVGGTPCHQLIGRREGPILLPMADPPGPGACLGGGRPPADDTPPRDAAEVEEDVAAPSGSQEPGRVAADVSYRGRVGEHDYLVR